MTETFQQIQAFYRKSWDNLTIFDLGMLSGAISMSIASGQPISLSHFNGYMQKAGSVTPVDRSDAAECLKLLSEVLIKRLKSMPQAEIEELDRQHKMLYGASQLPKRLSDPNI